MKKRTLAFLLCLTMLLALMPLATTAANGTGHKISVKVYKVVLDSSKPLGYQTPVLLDTITVICQDGTGHSGFNHSVLLKEFHPTNFGASTTDWSGWQFDSGFKPKSKIYDTFYTWKNDTVNATANVTGSEPYPCAKNFYLVYKDSNVIVKYNDGIAHGESFEEQSYTAKIGDSTPAWKSNHEGKTVPVWAKHVFAGWNPAVTDKVTAAVTYVAQWKNDENENGIPDDEEDKFTVIYNDGDAQGASFDDQTHENLLPGVATPAWESNHEGKTVPVWEDHVFVGWEPAVADTVTKSVTYVAQWKDDKNHNNIPDDQEDKFTVIYNDGDAQGASFDDQTHENLLPGVATPAWESNHEGKTVPVWEDHVFVGWEPAVADTVTKSVTYVAQWKDDKNHNNIPDDEEEKFTVTYTDGVDGEEVFPDQVYENLLSGTATPAFEGTPTREGYVFKGWNPEVAETVTGNATYTAIWKEDKNNNGIADDEEDKFTVRYTDGVDGEDVFPDQVYENLLSGTATPAFNGTPTREGYVFKGWNPEVAETVTGNATYTAIWEKDNGNGGDGDGDGDGDNDNTGDNEGPSSGDASNLLLWLAMLVVGGGAVIGTTVVGKKKMQSR